MRRLPAILVTVLLALLLIVVLVTAVSTVPTPSATAQTPATPEQPAPGTAGQQQPGQPGQGQPGQPAAAVTSVAFLGDGYTAGTPAGGRGPANYTAILAGQSGWKTVTNDSVYASGYVAGRALPTRVQQVVSAAPQLVVVNAGRADDQSDPAAVGAAATQLYNDLKTRLPQAKVVVIGPMWLGDGVPPRMTAVRDAIKGAATGAQLPFVDPIESRWFVGQDQNGVAAGGLDLNDAGHQRLAQLVGDALKQSGALG